MMFNDTNKLRDDLDIIDRMKAAGLTVTTPNVEAFRANMLKMFAASEFVQKAPAGWMDRIEALAQK
jgi:hypothetical protein